MAYKLIWSPSARLDLKELTSYIAESHPQASSRFVRNVFHTIEHLAAFPRSGRVVPEFGVQMIREVIRKPCRVVYRVIDEKETVEIVRLWHAARGIPQL